MTRLLAVIALVVVVFGGIGVVRLLSSGSSTPTSASATTPTSASEPTVHVTAVRAAGLHVVRNRLENAAGRAVVLRGVNRSGTEYSCVHGYGTFDGPSSAASVRAIRSWGATLVRVPINEDCWLGINGVPRAYSGAAYRAAIVAYVARLQRVGITPEVSLTWAGPGGYRATSQPAAPDADHSPAVWTSLARTFRHNPNVILGVWGEPAIGASCFANGGVCGATYGPSNAPYRSVGSKTAVRLIRAAGYRGVIAIPGVAWANDLSAWLANEPHDPLHQLVAEAHVYGGQDCSTTGCFDRTMLPVARRVPVLFGEVGENVPGTDCSAGAVQRILAWAAAHQVSWAAWTWDTWGTCGSLISSYSGTPANPFGALIRRTLKSPA
jgi:endoglucanase